MICFFVGKRCENAARVDLFGGIILFYFIFKGGRTRQRTGKRGSGIRIDEKKREIVARDEICRSLRGKRKLALRLPS